MGDGVDVDILDHKMFVSADFVEYSGYEYLFEVEVDLDEKKSDVGYFGYSSSQARNVVERY